MILAAPRYTRFLPEHDDVIRASWPDVRGIVDVIGHTVYSVRNRAGKLGLPCATGRPKRPLAEFERQMIVDRYPQEGAIALARELQRTRSDIVSFAQRLAVRCLYLRRWTTEDDQRLETLLRSGRRHAEIANELNRTTTAIGKRVIERGLGGPGYDQVKRRKMLMAPGGRSGNMCERRWARARLALGEHGWPPDFNPKEIQILQSLMIRGPQSRAALSASIGEAPHRSIRKRLMTHGGTSSMARVMARGLVARLQLTLSRKRVFVYSLTGSALEQKGKFQTVESYNRPIIEAKCNWSRAKENHRD